MRMYTSFTPRHWEFGFGVYIGSWFHHAISERLYRHPHEIALLLGPFSVCLIIGYQIEVIE